MEQPNTAQAQQPHTHGCFYCSTAKPLLQQLWSDATRGHFRQSRIEFLKGIRSIIDDRISHLSAHAEQKGTRVTVE
jgi:hypothetical protein